MIANSDNLDPLAIVYWPGSRGDFLATFLLDQLTARNYLRPSLDYMVPPYCKIHPDPMRSVYEVCSGALVSNSKNTSLTPAEWKDHAKLMSSAGHPVVRIQAETSQLIEITQFLWCKKNLDVQLEMESLNNSRQMNAIIANSQMDVDIWPYYSHFITWDNIFDINALIALYLDIHKRYPPDDTIIRAQANIEIQNKFLGRKK